MVEANMQTFFSKYVRAHLPETSEAYELKICKQSSIPFNALQEHQEQALLNAQTGGLYHKLTDPPIFYGGKTRFNIARPFDCFALVGIRSFVVLWFYRPRQKKVFIKIPIDKFVQERQMSERKSLTEERAKAIGELIYL